MKLTKEAKELIDKWFDNKTPEEVDYIISKYTPNKQLPIHGVSNCKRDKTLELLEEIIIKAKEADSEVENGIYDPMLECAKHILNNYKIERR